MRRIRNPGAFVTVVAIGASVFVYAGCGGGGDDGSTSAKATTVAIPTITQPAQPAPNGGSTTTTPKAPESNPANGAGRGNRPQGARSLQQLSAFRDCLSRRGVSLQDLTGAGGSGARQRDTEQFRAQAEKAFTCIPKLPPQLRESAEQLKRRFEQRQRNSGSSNG